MVKGIDTFRTWFEGYEDQYIIIGGTACDLVLTAENIDFRATNDIDMVLIVEALTSEFGKRFWEYVVQAGYEHKNKSTGEPQFYRFSHPKGTGYPAMIELFSRRSEAITLPAEAVLTPIPMEDEISSLSAIILDDSYYQFMKTGTVTINSVTVLDAAHIIPLKIRAWLDMSARKAEGQPVDSKSIRKHKNDVFRLSVLLAANTRVFVPRAVYSDIQTFLGRMIIEEVNVEQLGIKSTKDIVLQRIAAAYAEQLDV